MKEADPLYTFKTLGEEVMARVGHRLAPLLKVGDVVALRGDLGVGKTTLARAIIRSLLRDDVDVASPTFTLMQEYPFTAAGGEPGVILHCDLYRLEKAADVHSIGLLDMLDSHITLIEWPEIIDLLLPEQALHIHCTMEDSKNTRRLAFFGVGDWKERLRSLENLTHEPAGKSNS